MVLMVKDKVALTGGIMLTESELQAVNDSQLEQLL